MKIVTDALSLRIAKSDDPVYIISGDEILLVEETLDLLRSSLSKKGFTQRQLFYVDPSFDWSECLIALRQRSFVSEKRIVELRFASDKINAAGQKTLHQYWDMVSPDQVLVCIMPKLGMDTQKSAWFKALEQKSIWINQWPMNPSQLPLWIKQRLARYQLQLAPEAIQMIAECTEGNLLAAKQEIEKLHLAYGKNQSLSFEQVDHCLHDQAKFTIYDLSQAILERNPKRVLRILRELSQDGTEELLVLWVLTQILRNLLTILKNLQAGETLDTALTRAGIRAPQKPAYLKGLEYYKDTKALLGWLAYASQVDRMIKGAEPGFVWMELERLSLGLCGVNPL